MKIKKIDRVVITLQEAGGFLTTRSIALRCGFGTSKAALVGAYNCCIDLMRENNVRRVPGKSNKVGTKWLWIT